MPLLRVLWSRSVWGLVGTVAGWVVLASPSAWAAAECDGVPLFGACQTAYGAWPTGLPLTFSAYCDVGFVPELSVTDQGAGALVEVGIVVDTQVCPGDEVYRLEATLPPGDYCISAGEWRVLCVEVADVAEPSGCTHDSQCGFCGWCEGGVCHDGYASCSHDQDCEEGETCFMPQGDYCQSRCVSGESTSCVSDSDCAPCFGCYLGTCQLEGQASCTSDINCYAGSHCSVTEACDMVCVDVDALPYEPSAARSGGCGASAPSAAVLWALLVGLGLGVWRRRARPQPLILASAVVGVTMSSAHALEPPEPQCSLRPVNAACETPDHGGWLVGQSDLWVEVRCDAPLEVRMVGVGDGSLSEFSVAWVGPGCHGELFRVDGGLGEGVHTIWAATGDRILDHWTYALTVSECFDHPDCGEGLWCEDAQCMPAVGCRDDDDCDWGFCFDGMCEEYMTCGNDLLDEEDWACPYAGDSADLSSPEGEAVSGTARQAAGCAGGATSLWGWWLGLLVAVVRRRRDAPCPG